MASTEYFVKDYVLLKSEYDEAENGRQFNDVRQSAIQRGLRPTGDVEFVKSETHGAVSVRLYYRVPVVLASEADDYGVKHAFVSPTDQEGFEVFAGIEEEPRKALGQEPTDKTEGVGMLKSAVDESGDTPPRPTDPDSPAGDGTPAEAPADDEQPKRRSTKKKGSDA